MRNIFVRVGRRDETLQPLPLLRSASLGRKAFSNHSGHKKQQKVSKSCKDLGSDWSHAASVFSESSKFSMQTSSTHMSTLSFASTSEIDNHREIDPLKSSSVARVNKHRSKGLLVKTSSFAVRQQVDGKPMPLSLERKSSDASQVTVATKNIGEITACLAKTASCGDQRYSSREESRRCGDPQITPESEMSNNNAQAGRRPMRRMTPSTRDDDDDEDDLSVMSDLTGSASRSKKSNLMNTDTAVESEEAEDDDAAFFEALARRNRLRRQVRHRLQEKLRGLRDGSRCVTAFCSPVLMFKLQLLNTTVPVLRILEQIDPVPDQGLRKNQRKGNKKHPAECCSASSYSVEVVSGIDAILRWVNQWVDYCDWYRPVDNAALRKNPVKEVEHSTPLSRPAYFTEGGRIVQEQGALLQPLFDVWFQQWDVTMQRLDAYQLEEALKNHFAS